MLRLLSLLSVRRWRRGSMLKASSRPARTGLATLPSTGGSASCAPRCSEDDDGSCRNDGRLPPPLLLGAAAAPAAPPTPASAGAAAPPLLSRMPLVTGCRLPVLVSVPAVLMPAERRCKRVPIMLALWPPNVLPGGWPPGWLSDSLWWPGWPMDMMSPDALMEYPTWSETRQGGGQEAASRGNVRM